MRQSAWIFVLAMALLSACGGQPSAESATPAAAPAATAATESTSAPTSAATSAPTSAPTAAPATAVAEPTAAPSAAPTAELILPPTSAPAAAPTAASQPAAPAKPTDKPAAQPAPQPAAQPAAPKTDQGADAVPIRLVIGDIAVDNKVVSVGLDKQRVPIVPDHNVGWYNLSAEPGAGENIVLWGHVLRFRNAPNIPAPFARLKELKPGGEVVLYDRSGNPHRYVVKQQVWATPDQVEYILPQGREMVTMVSCIGDKVISNGEVVDESHRLITIAEPV